MASFIRISDIPPEELHLVPITGLRQQIREDRNRPTPLNIRTAHGETDGFRPAGPFHPKVPAAEVWTAAGERFVTDWQLHNDLRPGSCLPFAREDIDNDGYRDHEDFGEEDFGDPEDEDLGEEEETFPDHRNHNTGEDFDALYVDIGGEG